MTNDISFDTAVSEWIDNHTWPRNTGVTDKPQSIAVFRTYFDPPPPHSFGFLSAFNYFEIEVRGARATKFLNVQIRLVVPGKSEATTLIVADDYPLSTNEGQPLIFNLDHGYVHGSMSFKYQDYHGKQYIFVTYSAHLPFAGTVEGTVNIAPAKYDDSSVTLQNYDQPSDFTAEQLKAIPTSTASELNPVEENAQSTEVVIRELDSETKHQQDLLVDFLKYFVVKGQDSIVIETYYAGHSKQWEGVITFLRVLELVGSVDPRSFAISAVLYARMPIVGRVFLARIQGSLLGGGVSVDISNLVPVAKGNVKFTASRNSDGNHDLFVEESLHIKFFGKVGSDGKDRLLTFPF